jgi:hypothetical protein
LKENLGGNDIMTAHNRRDERKLDSVSRVFVPCLLLCLILSFFSPLCFAQKSTADILGTVTDSSGAVLPGVKITATNAETHDVRKETTDQTGSYHFTFLPPGTYSVRAESSGLKTITIDDLVVTVNEERRQDFALTVGTVQQEVRVTANPVTVNAESATLGGVVEEKRVADLPLNGRAFLQLATLLPGATDVDVPNSEDNGYAVAQRPGMSVSFAGVRAGSNEILFDGVPSKDNYENNIGLQPPPDSIAEFKVLQGYFSPEYGLPAVINVVTKSGTNSYHLSAWEFLRNDALDARNFFEAAPLPKGTLRQNQYGAAGGGALVKNKLFFWGDYEGLRIRSTSGSSFATLPTPAELNGDFSALLPTQQIFDPETYDPATGTRQPFPGNIIPADRISPFAKAYAQFIPSPVAGAPAPFNYVGTARTIQNDSKFDVRLDWVGSERDKVFGRFSWGNSSLENITPLPYSGTQIPLNVRNTSIGWTHTFSSRLVNEFRFGIDNVVIENSAPLDGASNPDFPKLLGIMNLNSTPQCNGLADVNMAGYSGLGGFNSCEIPHNNDPIYGDNVSYQHGRHFLTFGGEVKQVRETDIVSFSAIGTFAFTGQYSGNGAADFVLGDPNNAQGAQWTGPMNRRGWWPDLYFNDDFKVTRNFTLNYGVRWQYTQPLTEVNNKIEEIDFATGGNIVTAGQNGASRGLITPHKTDFAPRLGLAWAPFGSTTWAVRSSFGIFYDRLPGNEWAWQGISIPFLVSTSAISDPNVPTIDMSTLFPAVPVGDPNAVVAALAATGSPASMFNLENRHDPYLQQWTLSIEHTLPWGIFTQAAYVGSKGTHLSKRYDQNIAPLPSPTDTRPLQERVPFPQYGFILNDQGDANSYYQGMQLTARKAYSNGVVFQAAYTYSKCLDDDSYDGKATRNYYLADADKGRCIMDVRQRFVYSMVYDLPFGKSFTGAAKQALGGWQLNAIVSVQTGLPFSLYTESDPSNTGAIFAPRPQALCAGNLPASQRTLSRWFNTSCFALPAADTYGNDGAQNMDGPSNKVLNLALDKTFHLAESINLEFRAEAFNAFNHPNFGRPTPDVQSASFGQISTAGPGRQVQFGLKLMF